MKEVFTFDGKLYKTVALKNGEEHCEKCAFNECRECEYSPSIPACDADKREDGLNIYFVPLKTNFDRITESPEALAEQLVYSAWDGFNETVFSGIVSDGIRYEYKKRKEAVAATLEWLRREVKNEQ